MSRISNLPYMKESLCMPKLAMSFRMEALPAMSSADQTRCSFLEATTASTERTRTRQTTTIERVSCILVFLGLPSSIANFCGPPLRDHSGQRGESLITVGMKATARRINHKAVSKLRKTLMSEIPRCCHEDEASNGGRNPPWIEYFKVVVASQHQSAYRVR